jgi:CBS domain-containing protein
MKHTRVDELMTTMVLTVGPDDHVSRARDLMTGADVRHLPVVDAERRVVGILSNRDLLLAMFADGKVDAVMSRKVRFVRAGCLAEEAVSLMLAEKIGAVVVLDDTDRLVGIVTETDFLVAAQHALRGAQIGGGGTEF